MYTKRVKYIPCEGYYAQDRCWWFPIWTSTHDCPWNTELEAWHHLKGLGKAAAEIKYYYMYHSMREEE